MEVVVDVEARRRRGVGDRVNRALSPLAFLRLTRPQRRERVAFRSAARHRVARQRDDDGNEQCQHLDTLR